MQSVKVQNMRSIRSNKEAANQFIIVTSEGHYFQSYRSVIAFRPTVNGYFVDGVILDAHYWDYSTTTGKYRNEFLGEGTAETRAKIADGTYQLADLNG